MLSDVLRTVRLTGAVYFDIHARAPWVAETPATSRTGSRLIPGSEHVIAFHVMMAGWCWAYLADEPESAVRLQEGDALIVVGGDSHIMGTERTKPEPADIAMFCRPHDRPLPFVFNELGGQGASINLVCGYLGCDARPFNPILDALPRLLHLRASSYGGSLIHDLIRTALRESAQPTAGGETILSKLSELLFLQVVRDHVDGLPAEATGWLSGLRDPHIGKALGLMHARPAARWTIDALARNVGLSRSTFAERFAALIGVPPMHYLGRWRLQVAAQHLEHQGVSVAQVATLVGYESEAAFNRAFKKQAGVPPAAWRRLRNAPPERR